MGDIFLNCKYDYCVWESHFEIFRDNDNARGKLKLCACDKRVASIVDYCEEAPRIRGQLDLRLKLILNLILHCAGALHFGGRNRVIGMRICICDLWSRRR